MTVGIFANCTFCLKVKSLPRQQKKKLQTDITENGGKFSLLLNPQCTHIILDNAEIVSDSVLSRYQLSSIQKNHIHIANPDFIWESVKERRLLDVKNYDPRKSPDITPYPDQKASGSEAKTDDLSLDDLSLDDASEKENIVEFTKFSTEDVEIPHFPQDFEVAKYNTLEKVGVEGGREAVVVELQCSQDPGDCAFLISAHFLADGMQHRREFTVKKTSADASEYYEEYIEELKDQGFLLREHFTPEATQLASEKLQGLLLEEVIDSSTLSREVGDLVEMIWAEALGHLEHMLLQPVSSISLNDVSKAEGILQLARAALKTGETAEQLQKTMAEFYRLIPHRAPAPEEINLGLLAKKEDLCQLIRDLVNVCETNLSKPNPPSLAKYRALRCKIEHVEWNTEEFSRVKKVVLQNNRSQSPVDILEIFRVGRVNETTEFLSRLGNVRPLLHGSPVRNIVGILSRGLLLPKVVEDRGVKRTDVGNLGSGIYFSDSLSTSVKYSHPGETDGTRLLVVCDVALGKCVDLHKKDSSLTGAPAGYDSVHGVSETASVATDFEDDEFVVYKTNQVKMKYVVKFCMPGDQIKDFHPPDNTELEEHRPEFSGFSKVEDYQLPDSKPPSDVKAGLQDPSGNLVPLEDVHIKGRIIDFVAQVVVFQTYTNQSPVPIEAKYIFPLDEKAAVCGFEAFINGKHIVGEVKEKEEAQREYREAVSQGHGAYLMDQHAPDIFTVSVGNLPPKAKVLIKITYVTELSFQGAAAVFFMPAAVAPWQQDGALNENLQDAVKKICIKEIGTKQSFSLTMSIEMPYVIEFISSDTHELKQKRTDCKAVISTVEGSSLDSGGFSLRVGLSDAYLPRMWVEKHPDKESEACMLVFQPDLHVGLPDRATESEVIICLDCSNSMEGVTFLQAKQIALHALSLVGEKQKVNVVRFGTGYKELFSYPKCITSSVEPTEFIMSATPTMGNTEFWKTLRYLSLLYPCQGSRDILLVSDGHLQNESLTLRLVRRSLPHTRLFACGVGSTANRHVLRTLSQCGAGVFEYFNTKSKHNWKKQIEDQMTRLRSPSCHSVSVKWQQLGTDAPEPLQAPAQVPSLFHNDQLLVYGFIPHCTQATLGALIQEKEFCTMVSTTELQKTTGTMIHKLTARALIRDYEDGILHENETGHEMKKQILKSVIIKLSKENSLITQFTSFVAVEKRDENESPFPIVPEVSELIAKEDVDLLPYMSWQEEPRDAGVMQPLPASSERIEDSGFTECRTRKVKRKFKLRKKKVSEDADGDSLGPEPAAPASTPSLESEGVGKPLDLCLFSSKPSALQLRSSRIPCRNMLVSDCALGAANAGPPLLAASPLPLSAAAGAPRPVSAGPTLPVGAGPPPMVFVAQSVAVNLGPTCRVSATPTLPVTVGPPRPVNQGPTLPVSAGPPRHGLRGPKCRGQSGPDLPGLRDPNSPSHRGPASPGQPGPNSPCQRGPLRAARAAPASASGSPQGFLFGSLSRPRQFGLETRGLAGAGSAPFQSAAPRAMAFRSLPPAPLAGRFRVALSSGGSGPPAGTFPRMDSPRQPGLFLPPLPAAAPAKACASHKFPDLFGFHGEDDPVSLSPRYKPPVDLSETSRRGPGRLSPGSARTAPSHSLKSHWDDSSPEGLWETQCDGSSAQLPGESYLKRTRASLRAGEHVGETVCKRSWGSVLPWTELCSLQTEDGFWKLTPELGFILNLNIDALHSFLEEKGIQSLGIKGRECLLDLIATLLVLQFLRTRLEHKGIVFKSLMKLDDAASISRNIPWDFEAIKKANEWVRRTEGQYPSICPRLELGKDWDSATKQLLGLQPINTASPLHRVLCYSQG
nr:poly [ADP-ribose] polymerase 4 [Microcebus murinus]